MRREAQRPNVAVVAALSSPRVARAGVLVLGGGWAGRHVIRALADHGATLVEPSPIADLCAGVELVPGRAVGLDADQRVVAIETDHAFLALAYAQLVVALGGFAGTVARLGLPRDALGRIRVDEGLRVLGAANIWALGDCAALPNGAPHRSAPPALAAFYGAD